MPRISFVFVVAIWLLSIHADLIADQSRNVDQILQEIGDYQKQFRAPVGAEIFPIEEWRPDNKQLKEVIQKRVKSYIGALRDLEYLIRMKMIDRDQAVELARNLSTHDLIY